MEIILSQSIYFFQAVEAQVKEYCFITVMTQKYRNFIYLGPTGISAANIGGATIHSGLGIKPAMKLLDLNEKSKAASRNK